MPSPCSSCSLVATLSAVLVGLFVSCGQSDSEVSAANQAAAPFAGPSPEAAALAAYDGPRTLGVPTYPDAEAVDDLRESMREAWLAAGEPRQLFAVRLGERILATDDPFDLVREFYLPFAHKVFMDHEMDFPDVGAQRMFTGIVIAPDGTLVKLTVTRPYFRYPDQAPIDRTFIQLGRVGALGS